MTKINFSKILDSYFSKHLCLERKFSKNTYDTYLTVIRQYIEYLRKDKDLRPEDISISSFDKPTVLAFWNMWKTILVAA